jgi:lipopolysaccharide export system permease protein
VTKIPFTLYRYIIREIFTLFVSALIGFIAILLAMNLLKFASLIVSKGVAFSQISMVFLALIPTFLEIAIPMSMLLGVMLGLARLSGDSEIIVIRASGISIKTLAYPVVIFTLIISIFSLYTSFSLRPWGYNTLNKTLEEIASESTSAGIEKGIFTKLGDLNLYCENLDHVTGKMEHVLLDDQRDLNDRKIVFAKDGNIASDPLTKKLYISLLNGEIHQITEKGYAVTQFKENISVIEPQELLGTDNQKKGKPINSMGITDLNILLEEYQNTLNQLKINPSATINNPLEFHLGQKVFPHQYNKKELKKRINRVKIEKNRRISMPFAALAMGLIGLTLGIQSPRTQKTYGIGLSATLGLAVFVSYYSLLSLGIAMAESGKIPVLVSLWLPNIILIIVGMLFLKKLSSEQWQSITDGIVIFINKFIYKIKSNFVRA